MSYYLRVLEKDNEWEPIHIKGEMGLICHLADRYLDIEKIDKNDIKQVVTTCLNTLTEEEYEVVNYYFGINKEEIHDLDQLSLLLNKNKVDILDILNKSFDRLQMANPKKSLSRIRKQGEITTYEMSKIDIKKVLKEELKEFVEKKTLTEGGLLTTILHKNNIQLKVIPTINHDIRLEELDISIRSYNCLKRAGIYTLRQLLEKSNEELMQIRNVGKKSFEELKDICEHYDEYILPINDSSKDNALGKFEYEIIRHGEKTHLKIFMNILETKKISEMLYDELFSNNESSFLHYFSSPYPENITMMLILLGYIDMEDVLKDAKMLDEYLSMMGMTSQKEYLISQYKKVNSDYYRISQETYYTLCANPILTLKEVEDLLNFENDRTYLGVNQVKDLIEQKENELYINVKVLENYLSQMSNIDLGLVIMSKLSRKDVHLFLPLEDYLEEVNRLIMTSPENIKTKLDELVADKYLFDREALVEYIQHMIDPNYVCLSLYNLDDYYDDPYDDYHDEEDEVDEDILNLLRFDK